MTSTFGERFRVTTFGESHGHGVGAVIDGCPPGVPIDMMQIQAFLNRRKPGQSVYTTPRTENDAVELLSGLHEGKSLGSPIALVVRNTNQRSTDYADMETTYRPSHADYTTELKYGIRAAAGGGRSSARETIGRVAAASIAEQWIQHLSPATRVVAWVDRIADICACVDPDTASFAAVEASEIRCPDPEAEALMKQLILTVKKDGDTVGGTIRVVVQNPPTGLGEPIFDKFEATLAHAMLSLPASKSFEVGSGLSGTFLRGSEHNDAFVIEEGKVRTATNRSGGIQGGITNGMPIVATIGFKPVSTIFKKQSTVTQSGEQVLFSPRGGRHDPCVLPRAVPMVEAMTWLCLAEHLLRQRALTGRPI